VSMLLFALFWNPLICLLERHLTGNRIGYRTRKTAVIAHTDNFTIFVTAPADIQINGDLLLTYQRTTVVRLKIRKPKAMAAGLRDISMNMLDIPYYLEITIAVFRFTSTVARSRNVDWSSVIGKVKHWRGTRTVGTYVYNNESSMCIPYYSPRYATAQNFPEGTERPFVMTIFGCLWRGAINRVPLSTLQRQTEDGGMDLIDVAAKFRVLFFNSVWAQGDRREWLAAEAHFMGLAISQDEPPRVRVIPRTLEYLRIFFTNGRLWNPTGRPKQGGLLSEGCITSCELCILRRRNHGRYALCSFSQLVWGNLHYVILPDGARSACYMVIHDFIPTNVRSNRIRLMDMENCTHCGR
jgi:hypothetical protein